jgi:pyridoxine 4-dehydrogenase
MAAKALPGGTFTMAEDMTVARVGYGAMQLAGPGVFGPPRDRDAAVAVLREAMELGIDHIDTSDYYGPYVTNEIIKEALYPYPDELRIVTKVGALRDAEGGWPHARSPEQLRQAVHDNLTRLGLDALDVVNLRIGGFDSPEAGSLAEPFEALAQMQQEGLIKHLGVSTVSAEQVAEAQSIAPIVCVQNLYNIANRADDALIDSLAAQGIAYVPYFPLGGFVDGNGRTGRAIIHLVLRRRGLALRVLPPVSLVLATLVGDYVGGLTASRYVGRPSSSEASTGMNTWIATFAGACIRSVADATAFESRAAGLEEQWRERLGRVRANSATDLLLNRLPGVPVLTAESAATLLGRTFKPANDAIQRLVRTDILRQITIGRRNRAYEAPEIIEAFADLERQPASTAGDTWVSPPARAVPRGRSGVRP